MVELTQYQLKGMIKYDPITGKFTWKINRGSAKIGDIAGCPDAIGRIQIGINGKRLKAHRLAWLYMEGYLPEYEIDHKDRDHSNNKWGNLRVASHQCNMRNCKVSKNNTSGVVGVSYINKTDKWYASIMVNRRCISFGVYSNIDDAVKARWRAEIKYEFPNCNTTSSAYNYLKMRSLI